MSDGGLHVIKIPYAGAADVFRRAAQNVPGVVRVDVNETKKVARVISTRLIEPGELPLVRRVGGRPSWAGVLGAFAVVLLIGFLGERFGLFRPSVALGATVTVGAAFFVGLVAASSSCIAVSGGLMLSAVASFKAKLRTVFLFVGGRIISYAVLGSVIGGLGAALTPSSTVVGAITVLAALYMLKTGLDMLSLTPRWLHRILPPLPLAIGRKIMEREESRHPFAPMLLGAGTFFLPCGFTQSLQLYALTTGSILQSGLILGAFAVGTAPALLALGWASNSLKGKAGAFFFRFSGALVIVLGIWNIQNGMTVAGYPLRLPRFTLGRTSVAAAADAGGVAFDGKTQIATLRVEYSGYNPSNFTLRSGVPTKFLLEGPAAGQGCLAGFQIPALGIRKRLIPGETTEISFTAPAPGRYSFSCSMGMVRGEFTVI